MFKFSQLLRPLLVLIALGALAFGASACASEEHGAVVEGEPIEQGDLEYKVIFTRLLNIDDVEDRAYLAGQEPPPPGHSYLGVFVSIENLSDENSQEIPEDFEVIDTDGNTFEPLESESIYALRLGETVGPGDFVPAIDSPAQVGPIGGSLILFEVTDESTENRPLELIIPGPEEEARVILDI